MEQPLSQLDFDDGLERDHRHKVPPCRHDLELAAIYPCTANDSLNDHFLRRGYSTPSSGGVIRKLDAFGIKLQFVSLANMKEISFHSVQRQSRWKFPIQGPDINDTSLGFCREDGSCPARQRDEQHVPNTRQ